MSNNKNTDLFKNASVSKVVIKNIVPSIVSMIMVLIYNLADTFFIGQTNNAYMVAAVSLATPVFLLFMAIGMLFGIGGTSLISRKLGEGKEELAKKISSFCFWSGITLGLAGFAVIQIWMDPIAGLIGSTPDTIEYVKQYLSIVAMGIPFLIISNSFSNIIRAEGKATVAMTGMIIGNMVNIVLDPVFILGFGWDVSGVAIATVIGNLAAALFYIGYFCFKKSMLSISIRHFSAGYGIAKGVVAIGVPAALNSVLMSFSNITINNFINIYGDMAVAGLGVAMKVNMIAVMLLIGVGAGIQPVLGFCYGANNKQRFDAVLRFSLLFAIGLSLVMTAVCYFGASPMVSAFLQDESAHAYGMQFARILILSGPILGVMFVLINALQAMGAAVPSLILSISRQGLVFIPTLILFSRIFDSARMRVAAQPVADYMATLIAFILFLIVYRKDFKGKYQLFKRPAFRIRHSILGKR